ncbi:MAG: Hsp20/alpha crystallin family protein [Actinobacteria bacterium]|nr:Hsp20/alpha crystallin family protein [Actinomycetota bacterium]MCA1740358.1 Hsp20/alpha crystallin family protein [Actinomycetota bacterium]
MDISLHDNVLTISGERSAEQEEEHGGYHIRERRHGSFRRRGFDALGPNLSTILV